MNQNKGVTLSTYNPTIKDKLAWAVGDLFGRRNDSARLTAQGKVREIADYIPFLGDAIALEEAKTSYDAGNYGQAAAGAALAGVGLIPGVGDAVAAGSKKLTSDVFPGILGREWHPMLHGTKAETKFDQIQPGFGGKDLGIHVTKDPEIAASYAGLSPYKFDPIQAQSGRIMPVLAYKGNEFKGTDGLLPDPVIWTPTNVINAIENQHGYAPDELRWLVESLYNKTEFRDVQRAFRIRNYDSVTYDHYPLSSGREPGEATMLFTAQQAQPLYGDHGFTINSTPNRFPMPQGSKPFDEYYERVKNWPPNVD